MDWKDAEQDFHLNGPGEDLDVFSIGELELDGLLEYIYTQLHARDIDIDVEQEREPTPEELNELDESEPEDE